MAPMESAVELIDAAAAHLHSAAHNARQLGGEDSLSIWHAFAGQLELAAAGLSPGVSSEPASEARSVVDHISDAATALESIPPLQGPPDLAMRVWHVGELRRLAEAGDL